MPIAVISSFLAHQSVTPHTAVINLACAHLPQTFNTLLGVFYSKGSDLLSCTVPAMPEAFSIQQI